MDNKWKLALACIGSAIVGGGLVGLVLYETTPVIETPVIETPVIETPVIETPLRTAAINEIVNNKDMLGKAHIISVDFVKALIYLGMDVDQLDASGNTILINCVEYSTMNDGYRKTTLDIATYLVREANADTTIIGDRDKTALELAKEVSNQDMIALLS
jgi:ankyrin repeat protein